MFLWFGYWLILDYSFRFSLNKNVNLNKVWLGRVKKKCGFKRDGLERDDV